MKTKQETFDTVVRAILTQGKPSTDGANCRYRGAGGTKCAAGHLIPDEKYDPVMEGVACYSKPRLGNYRKESYERCVTVMTVLKEEGYDPEFVRELQKAHDHNIGGDFVVHFRRSVELLAKQFQLNLDVLKEFPL